VTPRLVGTNIVIDLLQNLLDAGSSQSPVQYKQTCLYYWILILVLFCLHCLYSKRMQLFAGGGTTN